MIGIFHLRFKNRPPRGKYKLNLEIIKTNQVKFRTNNLPVFDPKIKNSLPRHINFLKT